MSTKVMVWPRQESDLLVDAKNLYNYAQSEYYEQGPRYAATLAERAADMFEQVNATRLEHRARNFAAALRGERWKDRQPGLSPNRQSK